MGSQDSSAATGPRGWRDPWLWGVFALALAVRLLYLVDLRTTPFFASPQMDALYHDQWARRLAAGDWIGTGVFFRAPLYPYFLGALYALFGTDYVAVRVVHALVGSLTAFLTGGFAATRFGRRAGLLAGLLTALHGPLIFFEGELLLTVLEAPLNLLTAWSLDRALAGRSPRSWITAGVCLGMSALTRPTILAVLPVAAAYLFLRRGWQAWGPAVLYAGTVVLVLSPVLARNALVGGDLVPVASQGGLNYYLGNHPGADGMSAVAPEFRRTWTGGVEDATRLAEMAAGRPLRPSEVSDYWFGRALDWARNSPGAFLLHQARKLALLWDGFEIPNNEDYYYFSSRARIFRVPLLFSFGLLGPLAAAGVVLALLRRRIPFAWVGVPVVLGCVIAAFFVCGRFRASLVPLFAVWGGVGVSLALETVAGRKWGSVGVYAGVLLATGILIHSDPWGLRRNYSTAESHLRLGIHFAASGNPARAEEHYLASVAADSGFADGWNNLGVLRAQTGRSAEARSAFERALALRPGHPKALGNLAALAFSEGRPEEAESLAQRVLQVPAWEPEALYNAAVVLGNLGDPGAALRGFRAILDRDPGHAPARIGEARALLLLGRSGEALAVLRNHPAGRRTPELERLIEEIEP